MDKTVRKQNYAISINALSILRYMTDYITDLPLSVMTRLLNTKGLYKNIYQKILKIIVN